MRSTILFETELFGHERGAFTGANTSKPGLVEAASGGTLFLDEVGDIALAMQVKLLRLLESGTYRRVGSTELRRTDVRVVSATHRNLRAMVADGLFRFPGNVRELRNVLERAALLADGDSIEPEHVERALDADLALSMVDIARTTSPEASSSISERSLYRRLRELDDDSDFA